MQHRYMRRMAKWNRIHGMTQIGETKGNSEAYIAATIAIYVFCILIYRMQQQKKNFFTLYRNGSSVRFVGWDALETRMQILQCTHSTSTLFVCEKISISKMAGDVLSLSRRIRLSRCPVCSSAFACAQCVLNSRRFSSHILHIVFPFVGSAPSVNHSFYLHLIRLSFRFVALNRFYHISFWFHFFFFSFFVRSRSRACCSCIRCIVFVLDVR